MIRWTHTCPVQLFGKEEYEDGRWGGERPEGGRWKVERVRG
jgi:hypothetical protein